MLGLTFTDYLPSIDDLINFMIGCDREGIALVYPSMLRLRPASSTFIEASFAVDCFFDLLANDEVEVIMLGAGGLGSLKVIPLLRDRLLGEGYSMKPVCGMSDSGVILTALSRMGFSCVYMPNALYDFDITLKCFKELAKKKIDVWDYGWVAGMPFPCEGKGEVVPLHLSSCRGLIGHELVSLTKDIEASPVFFIEDGGITTNGVPVETPMRVSYFLQALEHYRQAGIFNNAQGIVFGDVVNDVGGLVRKAIASLSEELKIPCISEVGFGHKVFNFPLPSGVSVSFTFESFYARFIFNNDERIWSAFKKFKL